MTDPRRTSGSSGSRWTIATLLADLEQQAAGQAQEERADEVSALQVASYAEVDLAARLHGAFHRSAPGLDLDVRLEGGERLRGVLVRVGSDFVVLEAAGSLQWAIPFAAVSTVAGLVERSLVADARPLTARLGVASLLRELAEHGAEVSVVLRDGGRIEGRVQRVGADFVELEAAEGLLVHLTAVAAVCLR